jgi:predicted TIM-barrel fold metal-dependent hydrolase
MNSHSTSGSQRLLVISSDGHIGPPAERYREYVSPKYRDDFDQWFAEYIPIWMTKGTRAKDSVKDVDADVMWGKEYQKEFERRAQEIPWGIEGKWDSKRRLDALDIDGVAADVMFPDDQSANSPPFLGLSRPFTWRWNKYSPELMREGARAYNRWLADFCSAAPERLLGVGLIGSLADVDDAIETVKIAKEAGLGGGMLLPVNYYNVDEPFWNHRRYDRLWSVCEELGMPLQTHVGQGSPGYDTEDAFEGGLLWAMESTYWVHRPLWFFILSGVLERHPRLKLAFTEQGVRWAVEAVMMMDGLLEAKITPFSQDKRRKMLSLKPSEYFNRQCWIGATYTDALGWASPEDREILGYKSLMWGSDYPHLESAWPKTRQSLRDLMKGIPEDEVKAIIAANAVECYGIDMAKLAATVERIGPEAHEIIAE